MGRTSKKLMAGAQANEMLTWTLYSLLLENRVSDLYRLLRDVDE